MKIRAFRDKGWFDKNTEYRLWSQVCRAYNVEFEIIDELHDLENIIIFEEKGKINLEDFNHPKNTIYVFGRSGQDLMINYSNFITVRIETPSPVPLFGFEACAIILEDRKRKCLLR